MYKKWELIRDVALIYQLENMDVRDVAELYPIKQGKIKTKFNYLESKNLTSY